MSANRPACVAGGVFGRDDCACSVLQSVVEADLFVESWKERPRVSFMARFSYTLFTSGSD